MADSILNLILKSIKTGSGVDDAARSLRQLNQQNITAQSAAVKSSIAFMAQATALKNNSSLANVTRQAQMGLREEFKAGMLTGQQYTAVMEASSKQAGLMSPASIKAATSLRGLNSDFAAGKITLAQYDAGLKTVHRQLALAEIPAKAAHAAIELFKVGLIAAAAALVDVVKTTGDFEYSM